MILKSEPNRRRQKLHSSAAGVFVTIFIVEGASIGIDRKYAGNY